MIGMLHIGLLVFFSPAPRIRDNTPTPSYVFPEFPLALNSLDEGRPKAPT